MSESARRVKVPTDATLLNSRKSAMRTKAVAQPVQAP